MTETIEYLADYEGFLGLKTRPLSKQETEMFLQLTLMEQATNKEPAKLPELEALFEKDLGTNFGYQVFVKRIAWGKVPVHPCLRIFLVSLCHNPAECVLWAYTLSLIYTKERKTEGNEGKPITMATWVNYFPMGVPTEEEIERIWDAQKRKERPNPHLTPDNWVDYAAQWPTLRDAATEAPPETKPDVPG